MKEKFCLSKKEAKGLLHYLDGDSHMTDIDVFDKMYSDLYEFVYESGDFNDEEEEEE